MGPMGPWALHTNVWASMGPWIPWAHGPYIQMSGPEAGQVACQGAGPLTGPTVRPNAPGSGTWLYKDTRLLGPRFTRPRL